MGIDETETETGWSSLDLEVFFMILDNFSSDNNEEMEFGHTVDDSGGWVPVVELADGHRVTLGRRCDPTDCPLTTWTRELNGNFLDKLNVHSQSKKP